MATISKENYLKAIYNLAGQNGDSISTSLLAKELNISNSAISEMASRLSDQGFIDYKKYKGIKILSKGKKIAKNVLRKHRLWELFLIDTLNMNWGEVHDEAEKLEHSTSENLIDRIDEYLNYPSTDPHGAPIPDKSGDYRLNVDDFSMANCEVGESYSISRVNDKRKDLISYLSKINLTLNKRVKVLDRLEFDGSLIIEIDNVSHTLSEKVIDNIFIKKIS
jgi:DtxR family Mn-dependent transcriptional regulator